MPAAAFFFDWQNWVTLGIGLVALIYLLRRWGLGRRPERASAPSCGQLPPGESAPASACGGGCGSCESSGMPQRDHRITVQRAKAR